MHDRKDDDWFLRNERPISEQDENLEPEERNRQRQENPIETFDGPVKDRSYDAKISGVKQALYTESSVRSVHSNISMHKRRKHKMHHQNHHQGPIDLYPKYHREDTIVKESAAYKISDRNQQYKTYEEQQMAELVERRITIERGRIRQKEAHNKRRAGIAAQIL